MNKEVLGVLWIRDTMNSQYSGIEVGYKIHNKYETVGAFGINLLDTYKELYEVTNLKIVQDFLNQKQVEQYVRDGKNT
jgi:hypothetical protein